MLAAALVQLDRLAEARSAVGAGLTLNPSFSIAQARAAWTVMGDGPLVLVRAEQILDGLRKAGLPER